MPHFIAHIKPKYFSPMPDGTILRYRGHTYEKDRGEYQVWMDVIGRPTEDWDVEGNAITKVGDTIEIPYLR